MKCYIITREWISQNCALYPYASHFWYDISPHRFTFCMIRFIKAECPWNAVWASFSLTICNNNSFRWYQPVDFAVWMSQYYTRCHGIRDTCGPYKSLPQVSIMANADFQLSRDQLLLGQIRPHKYWFAWHCGGVFALIDKHRIKPLLKQQCITSVIVEWDLAGQVLRKCHIKHYYHYYIIWHFYLSDSEFLQPALT